MSHEHAIGFDLASPGGDMSVLSVMRDDVLLFVTEITGLPLQPWQAEVLKSATEYNARRYAHDRALAPYYSALKDYQRQLNASVFRMLRPMRKRGKHTKHGGYTWIRTCDTTSRSQTIRRRADAWRAASSALKNGTLTVSPPWS